MPRTRFASSPLTHHPSPIAHHPSPITHHLSHRQADPQHSKAIHLAQAPDVLVVDEGIVESEIDRSRTSDLIHVDEFNMWYAERKVSHSQHRAVPTDAAAKPVDGDALDDALGA